METINHNIECSVCTCAHYREHHCTLNAIKVGCCESNVGNCRGTECDSFRLQEGKTCCE